MYWSEIPRAESLNHRIGKRVYTRKSQVRSAADYPSLTKFFRAVTLGLSPHVVA